MRITEMHPPARLVFVVVFGLSGKLLAADNLPLLRVDPALLGQGTAKPLPSRSAETSVIESKPVQAVSREKGASEVSESKKAVSASSPQEIRSAPPEPASKAVESAPRPAPAAAAARAERPEPPSSSAGGGLFLRTDPSAQTRARPQQEAARAAPAVEAAPLAPLQPQLSQPPQVEERPALPPLYSAHADAGQLPAPSLKLTTSLSPLPLEGKVAYPAFLRAAQINARDDNEFVAEGEVELRKANTVLKTDRLTYWRVEDEVEAEGNVRLNRDADVISGPKVRMNMTEGTGVFEQPRYSIIRAARPPQQASPALQVRRIPPPTVIAGEVVSDTRDLTTGSGTADRLEFLSDNRIRLINTTYSTCTADPPDWYAKVGELNLDYDREVGEARDAKIVFKDATLISVPWLDFSINNKRKSGLLAPTFGSSTKTGTEITQPIYWDIAPNMDATLSPRFMSKRGLQWNLEYRYLEQNYFGLIRGEWLPDDIVLHKRRSGFSLEHDQKFGEGFSASLNLNTVSDSTYFTDLSSRIAMTSLGNLLRQGKLNYNGGWWKATANVQRYQTLEDPSLPPLEKPYDRLPQLTLNANQPDVNGAALSFNAEYVDFSHPTKVIGRRLSLYPQVSLPWQMPAYYVTPKVGYHLTRYDLSRQDPGVPESIHRGMPIFSLDSGVVFERDFSWEGRAMTQTLEPRLFYLKVPRRQQDQIPNFDSNAYDLNFATIFSENVFSGGDRVADANHLTAALVSRLIDPQTGKEYLRGMVGQRYYFSDQEVTLPGFPGRPGGAADFLAALSGQVVKNTYVDAGWQYNPRDKHTERYVLGGRWQPDFAKVVNASYRYIRDSAAVPAAQGVRQLDLSAQWPLGGGWYGVGRYNYSLRDSKLLESVGGLEFDGGCWVLRFVVQRFATTTGTSNTSFHAQLELNGFSRIGSKPFEILSRSIRGYGQINNPTANPAFGAD